MRNLLWERWPTPRLLTRAGDRSPAALLLGRSGRWLRWGVFFARPGIHGDNDDVDDDGEVPRPTFWDPGTFKPGL